MPKQHHATDRVRIVDVARASGFSTSTVSIVLNEAELSQYVAAATKEHIREVAARMGYRPDASARSLRSRRSQTIGILVSDISDPFCTLILQGIEKTIYPTAYLPIIMIAHNQSKQFGRHLEMLMERRVEGLILVANWLFGDFHQLSELEKANLPTVAVGRNLSARHVYSIQSDNEAGGYAAAKHLYELGHRRIAVLRGSSELEDNDHRWLGIQNFAAEVGLTVAPECVIQLEPTIEPTAGFDAAFRRIVELIESGAEFTALITSDDLAGLGAMRALRYKGRRVPEDCSVIGFDDIPHAALNTPGLTTIRQPMEEMGSLAARWVLDSLASHGSLASPTADGINTEELAHPGSLRLMPIELVARDSTARLKT